MNGPEISQCLRVILSHPDTTIEEGLALLDPGERQRLLMDLRNVSGALRDYEVTEGA